MEEKQNPYIIPLSILASGILVAGAIMYSGSTGKGGSLLANIGKAPTVAEDEGPAANPSTEGMQTISGEDHIIGDANAPVKIVEFSDLECPFCSRFHVTMKQVMEEYGKDGRVAWVYRHFPLEQIHQYARPAAEGAECANDMGGAEKFWTYIDGVFSRQSEGLSSALLVDVGQSIGLERGSFETCMNSAGHASKIDKNIEDAIASGGSGTPYSIIIAPDGSKTSINGALPLASVKAAVEAALAKD